MPVRCKKCGKKKPGMGGIGGIALCKKCTEKAKRLLKAWTGEENPFTPKSQDPDYPKKLKCKLCDQELTDRKEAENHLSEWHPEKVNYYDLWIYGEDSEQIDKYTEKLEETPPRLDDFYKDLLSELDLAQAIVFKVSKNLQDDVLKTRLDVSFENIEETMTQLENERLEAQAEEDEKLIDSCSYKDFKKFNPFMGDQDE